MIGTFHIAVAMKPLAANFVANAKKHGVAGLNIDGTRVSGPKGAGVWGTSNRTVSRDRKFNASPEMGDYRSQQHEGGRWPANVILAHASGCRCVGVKRVKSDGHHSYKIPEDGGLYRLGLKTLDDKGNPYAVDGKESVEHWECTEDCPVAAMDKQSGALKSGDGNFRRKRHETNSMAGSLGEPRDCEEVSYGDKGGASRFFRQIREE